MLYIFPENNNNNNNNKIQTAFNKILLYHISPCLDWIVSIFYDNFQWL